MRRSLTFPVLKRLAAAATISLLLITLISIKVSCSLWFPSAAFMGVQHGRIVWSEHATVHKEFSLHLDWVEPGLYWNATPEPPTQPKVPGLGGIPIIGSLFRRTWSRFVPLW